MSYDRNKVIKIATNEVGYLEKSKAAYKKNPEIVDQKTAGAGFDNYTKYGRDMHKIYPSVMDFPAPWCDCFVDWCFHKAYGISTAKSLLAGNFNDYTVASAQMYEKHNALDKKPEVGSQIFFTKNGKSSGCYHTGLVVEVMNGGKAVVTIEGNTSATGSNIERNGGCVAKKVRNVTSNTLFGHPKYGDKSSPSNQTTAKTTSTKITKAAAAQKFDKKLAGTYTVSALKTGLLYGPGTSDGKEYASILSVPKGKKVSCYGYYGFSDKKAKYLYVVYNGKNGFLKSSCLKKA